MDLDQARTFEFRSQRIYNLTAAAGLAAGSTAKGHGPSEARPMQRNAVTQSVQVFEVFKMRHGPTLPIQTSGYCEPACGTSVA